jgi:UDP-3-O-acyl-N-acetylglucosamine deacetylase
MCAVPTLLQPVAGEPGEARLQAHVSNMKRGYEHCTVLAQGTTVVQGVEHLLAALECCGVDNARIEIEGGSGEACLGVVWHGRKCS